MLAPPPGFSQLATSFLAWLHLGIPRALLPRLVCPCLYLTQRQPHHASNRPLPQTRQRFRSSIPKALFFPAPNTHVFNQQLAPAIRGRPRSRGLKTAPGLRAPFPSIRESRCGTVRVVRL